MARPPRRPAPRPSPPCAARARQSLWSRVAAAETLALVATCASGLEEMLDGELEALGVASRQRQRGGVRFAGGWPECWRANWRLRTPNRVLVDLASWPAADGAALAAGARAVAAGRTSGGASADGLGGVERAALSAALLARAALVH